MGRATTYNLTIADEIVHRIADGETLRAICRDEHMPAWRTVYDWIGEHEEFAARIARSRDLGFDAIAEDTIAMIDEAPERCATPAGDKVDAGYVQWQKNRVEQRLKLLAKWSPKYRDQQRVELAGGTKDQIRIVSEFDGDDLV